MYLLKSGMIRLFTRRNTTLIEIDTVRAGQILGELAFLDGNPRSLSGEALTECELVEISGPMFMDVLGKAPDWLKILLKTVVGRLRAANTRLRQLESSNSPLNYDKDSGKRTAYQYLTYLELIKVMTALLLVGSRSTQKATAGIDLDLGLVNRYAHSIMGVPFSKITSVIEILVDMQLASTEEVKGNPRAYLKNINTLEMLIEFLNAQNLLEPTKRQEISIRGLAIMGLIAENLVNAPKDANGLTTLDLILIKNNSTQSGHRDPFRNEELAELVKLTYISELKIKSQEQIFTTIQSDEFLKSYFCMQMIAAIKSVNEQKNQIAGSGK